MFLNVIIVTVRQNPTHARKCKKILRLHPAIYPVVLQKMVSYTKNTVFDFFSFFVYLSMSKSNLRKALLKGTKDHKLFLPLIHDMSYIQHHNI